MSPASVFLIIATAVSYAWKENLEWKALQPEYELERDSIVKKTKKAKVVMWIFLILAALSMYSIL